MPTIDLPFQVTMPGYGVMFGPGSELTYTVPTDFPK